RSERPAPVPDEVARHGDEEGHRGREAVVEADLVQAQREGGQVDDVARRAHRGEARQLQPVRRVANAAPHARREGDRCLGGGHRPDDTSRRAGPPGPRRAAKLHGRVTATLRITRSHGAVAVGAAAVVAIVILDALVRDEPTPRGDDLIYERMAQDPFATHTFPFAYRVLVPTIVHVLPFGHTFSFSLLAWLATAISAGFLYVLVQRVGAPPALALGLALCLGLSPPLLLVSLRQGRNVDAATVAVMVAAVLFMIDERPRALAVTLAIGALT